MYLQCATIIILIFGANVKDKYYFFLIKGVDKSMIGNTFLKKIRWKCILKEFVVLRGAVGDEQHNNFGTSENFV